MLVAGALALAVLSHHPFDLPSDADSSGPSEPGQAVPDEPVQTPSGRNCWDLNANWIGDPEEDLNGDGVVNILDCQGATGSAGTDGLECWDINGNGVRDAIEDVNGDGTVDVLDCRGEQGVDGAACWDLNANGIRDAAEDINGDLSVNALDCRGVSGTDGQNGTNGLNCWDSNGNHIGDPFEDINGDFVVNILDCQGALGADGQNGTNGLNCWDINGNHIGDPLEDINGDFVVNILDCQGALGANGQNGTNGLNCWDLNGNGIGDPFEDINGDHVVNILDCRGPQGNDGQDGADGLNCWDLNGNGVGDPSEDRNGDRLVDVLDCQGAPGATGGAGSALFDTFIDQFFTLEQGSYGAVSANVTDLPIVEINEPALGECAGNDVDVVAYRTAIPKHYNPENPVTMALFIWRTGPRDGHPVVLRLDAFHTRHSTGIERYGEPRYLLLDIPGNAGPVGQTLVVELPVNNEDGSLANGLGFPNMLAPLDLLAFEINTVSGFGDGGCYVLLGVEFFESASHQSLHLEHAAVFRSINDLPPRGSDCNDNGYPDDQDVGRWVTSGMFVICHDSPGNFDPPRTIGVPLSLLDAHLGHGDLPHACSADCNGNGVPDECEDDCNRDGIPDDCDGGCGATAQGGAGYSSSIIEFRSPSAEAIVADEVYVQAAVSDLDGLATVAWLIDGTQVLSMPVSGQASGVSFLWQTNEWLSGQHALSILVTDSTGAQTTGILNVVKE